MLGTLVKALVEALLEEKELYSGDGIVTNSGGIHEHIDRLVGELDKMTAPSWEGLRDALENSRRLPLAPGG